MQNIEIQPFPTYVITSFPINEIQLRYGKMIKKIKSSLVIKEEDPHIEFEHKLFEPI